jgi:membrane-anchored protein YejM (alkaline phosphatase superfamily)
LVTLIVKLHRVIRTDPASPLVAFGDVALTDVAVFLGAYALIRCCHLGRGGRLLPGLSILLALLLALWSVLDSAWMFTVGSPLRIEVLGLLIHDAGHCWPIVLSRAQDNVVSMFLAVIVLGVVAYWSIRRMRRVRPRVEERRKLLRRIGAALGLLALAVGGQHLCQRQSGLGYTGMLLRPSSHLGVAQALAPWGWGGQAEGLPDEQRLPRAGQRRINPPDVASTELPNVVVVLAESVGHWATTLADPLQPTTPVLARLAAEGVEFTTTRVCVTRTHKSMFAVMMGVSPSIEPEKVEAVLVDPPYESLATVLQGCGYRAGFFQMAKAESCHPPLFANMGFQHFWSRENLEDPSKHLTYIAGDDFAMLDPAFAWARQQPGPYLLMLMTSVAHDPYTVPRWYGSPRQTEVERYSQCVEYTDAFLGEVRERIGQLGAQRETLLCVIGDHGEGFPFQHELWGHLDIPFDEALRVPWVVWWPQKVPAGTRVQAPCSILDVTPTLLALLGFDIREAGFEGRNALGPPEAGVRHYFACWGNRAPRGYVEGDSKYIYNPQAAAVVRYDLSQDPLETSPVTLRGTAAREVVQTLDKWQRERKLHFPADRFVKRVLFEHWPAWSSGRNSWAYYRP